MVLRVSSVVMGDPKGDNDESEGNKVCFEQQLHDLKI